MYMYNVYVHCTYTYYNMYTEYIYIYIYVSFLQPKTNNGAYNLVYSFTYSNSINT